MRVTDDMVQSALTWARNYEEIKSFKLVAARGRKWLIELPEPRLIGSGFFLHFFGVRPEDMVPSEIVLTSREALTFAYGCAVGGIHDRTEFAREHWGWGEDDDESETPAAVKGLQDGV